MAQSKKKWKKAHTKRVFKVIGLFSAYMILVIIEVALDSILYMFELIHRPILKAKNHMLKRIRKHTRSIKSVIQLERNENE